VARGEIPFFRFGACVPFKFFFCPVGLWEGRKLDVFFFQRVVFLAGGPAPCFPNGFAFGSLS